MIKKLTLLFYAYSKFTVDNSVLVAIFASYDQVTILQKTLPECEYSQVNV